MPKISIAPVRRRRKEARSQELLDAALSLFVEKGYAATRTDDVAERAGVSKGTLYLYYASKEDLLKAVIRGSLSNTIAEGIGIAEEFQGKASELLVLLLRVWWERVGESPASAIHKIMMSEARNFPELAQFYQEEVVQPAISLVMGTLQRGVAQGEFRSDLPLDAMTHVAYAPLIFMALHKHSFGACGMDIDMGRVLEAHIELLLNGLIRQPPSATRKRQAAASPPASRKERKQA